MPTKWHYRGIHLGVLAEKLFSTCFPPETNVFHPRSMPNTRTRVQPITIKQLITQLPNTAEHTGQTAAEHTNTVNAAEHAFIPTAWGHSAKSPNTNAEHSRTRVHIHAAPSKARLNKMPNTAEHSAEQSRPQRRTQGPAFGTQHRTQRQTQRSPNTERRPHRTRAHRTLGFPQNWWMINLSFKGS